MSANRRFKHIQADWLGEMRIDTSVFGAALVFHFPPQPVTAASILSPSLPVAQILVVAA